MVSSQLYVNRILRTPLPPPGVEDRLIWKNSKDGVFSVKSGYRYASMICHDASLEVPGKWSALWKLKIPPRVKDFLWRVCRDCLPSRVNLFRKRVTTNKECPFCGYHEETNWHLFMGCQFAKECWSQVHLWHYLDNMIWVIDGFRELIFHMLESASKSMVESFVMTLWQIWKERNDRVWNTIKHTPTQVVFAAAVSLQEWKAARSPERSEDHTMDFDSRLEVGRIGQCRSWHTPETGFVKINVDAAFFDDSNQTGIGMVIRDEGGKFILARTKIIQGRQDVDVGEAMGFLEALSWVKELGFDKVVIEGDAKVVVEAIGTPSTSVSVLGDYINACKTILRCNPNFVIHYVRREANMMAHEFARVSRDYGNSYCWLDPPNFVDGLADHQCVCNNEN